MSIVSFYISNEGDLEKFKSQTQKLVKYIKSWGEYYEGNFVLNGAVKPVVDVYDQIDAFQMYVLENAKEVEGEITFPNDSPYLVKERDHNDLELGDLNVKNSLALISPYEGQIDSLNIQIITKSQSVQDHIEGFEWEDGLGFFVHIADENGNFAEMDV